MGRAERRHRVQRGCGETGSRSGKTDFTLVTSTAGLQPRWEGYGTRKDRDEEAAVDWWVWVIIVVIAVLALVALAAVVQRRRRRGGVIGLGDSARRGDR